MTFISQDKTIQVLRLSLGITFFWFGILKLFDSSPITPIIKQALPQTISDSNIFFLLLALAEILIGLSFLTNRLVKLAVLVMIVHLVVATISVLLTQGFDPHFPVLSLEGEFVVKNLVLMAAGFVLLSSHQDKKETV